MRNMQNQQKIGTCFKQHCDKYKRLLKGEKMKRILFSALIACSLSAHSIAAHVAVTAGAHHNVSSDNEEAMNEEDLYQLIQSSKDIKGVLICSAYSKSTSRGHLYDGCEIGGWSSVHQSINEFFNKNKSHESDEIFAIYFNQREKSFLIYYK